MTTDLPLWRILIDGQWQDGADQFDLLDKYSGNVIGHVVAAGQADVERAVGAARSAFECGFIEPYERYLILMRAAEILEHQLDAIVEEMIGETGFTRSDCQADTKRALQTLRTSAEEAKRIVGEIVPIHAAPAQTSRRLAYTVRDPVGVVCAITPFNSPLNTVCHKVAPALAAGNSVVLKPASYTPISSVRLCEILIEAGVPAGWLNLVHGGGSRAGQWLLEHQGIDYYTFTGSTGVGRVIQSAAGLRRTQLELGNISGTIICADADLDYAVTRCVNSTFRKAGQVCTSVQRLIVEASCLDRFLAQLCEATAKLQVGDPRAEETFVGPMIAEKEVDRAQQWIGESLDAGAKVVLGGTRDRFVLQPTILTDVSTHMKVFAEEIFAPVVNVLPFETLDEAIHLVNHSPFGLAGGIFTSNINTGLKAARKVRVGAFHINDTSSSRVDLMPYGGVKDSGHGLEGPKYAIRDMTEERLITITPTF